MATPARTDLLKGTILDGVSTLTAGSYFHTKALARAAAGKTSSTFTVLELLDENHEATALKGVAVLEAHRVFVDGRTGVTFPGSEYTLVGPTSALTLTATGGKRLRAGRALGWFDGREHLELLERQDLAPLREVASVGSLEEVADTLAEHAELLAFLSGHGTYRGRDD